jgi:predicted DsbA family dithiol-disulfide isomerase
MLTLEFHFDLICPWCLIAKQHLRRALQQLALEHPGLPVRVEWRAVQLLPHVPPQGLPYAEFYHQRLGSAPAVARRKAQVREAAAEAGVALNLEGIPLLPSTTAALHLLHHAAVHASPLQQERLIDWLFAAYFERGQNLGDEAVLQAGAAACGLTGASAWPGVQATEDWALPNPAPLGTMVPMVVFNNRQALIGMQTAPALLAAMRQALQLPLRPLAACRP